jgi:hypothetical protein
MLTSSITVQQLHSIGKTATCRLYYTIMFESGMIPHTGFELKHLIQEKVCNFQKTKIK